ncbi:MAG: SDR family NAD(P)-dependent oxidoreductase [Geminicoccaceae bacterium]
MTDPFDLDGKVALVTGASQGLGTRFATTLAERGAKVALAARQVEKLDSLKLDIERRGGVASVARLDVTDASSIEACFEQASDDLGPLDILVNNAGVAVSKSVLEQTEADWDKVVGTNLKGAFFVAQAAARRMVGRGDGGAIVNIASVLALEVIGHLGPYAASKGGIWQVTKTMALELARHDIRVNALAPGYIETDINRDFLRSQTGQQMVKKVPQRRYGEPEDLDGALLLLASDAGRYITGSVIVVDGGFMLQ